MKNKDKNNKLDNNKFDIFLAKIIGFIWTFAIVRSGGTSALRTPVYTEMINIIKDKSVDFAEFRFNKDEINQIKTAFETDSFFSNGRPITKSMLTWWALINSKQELPKTDTKFEIEHIYSKNRNKNDQKLNNSSNLESLGNKSLLEKRINIRVSDYRFVDKIKYYQGSNNKGKKKDGEGTQINELLELSKKYKNFTEKNIEERNRQIRDRFISFVKENDLIQK